MLLPVFKENRNPAESYRYGRVAPRDRSVLSRGRVFARVRMRDLSATASVIALSAFLAASPLSGQSTVHAQEITEQLASAKPDSNAQMLLEADEVTYDNDQQIIVASGNVQIAYNDYTLVAQQVTYDRKSGRVIATGGVEVLEPTGNRIMAQEIDITDDFSDGFVSALSVDTTDNTKIAAEGAERRDGQITEFTNGVYTACEPCKNIKGNPPFWAIRSKKVILDNKTRTVSYEGATFELFGMPIAYLPHFSHADPSIKRKSGFLMPEIDYTKELGYMGKFSYFAALAPNYDLTLSGGYYSEQGFLGEAEWRHRLENGQYFLRYAGINQQKKENFTNGTIDRNEDDRFAVMSAGDFNINSRWKFGWNWLYQGDENFARTYKLNGYDGRDVDNNVYLTGIGEKNYFDLRAHHFLVQDNRRDVDSRTRGNQTFTDQQGDVLPILDYNTVSERDVLGGQLSADFNVTNIHRDHGQIFQNKGYDTRNYGIKGNYVRGSGELDWKKSAVLDSGLLMTFEANGRADAIHFDPKTPVAGGIYNENPESANQSPLMSSDSLYRTMGAGMMEIRYPMVARDNYATHIFEPIGQIIARTDETHIGEFPNEDAQSMVFDTTNLFRMNKFSGYDRVEGGTRANVGFRYSASFSQGGTLNVVAGQSFHLGGKNSFEKRDLVNAGMESGLETDRSDYVASLDYTTAAGMTFSAAGRFDESNLDMRRADAAMSYISPWGSFRTSYVYIDKQPEYGLNEERHEVRGSASLKLDENWRTFGNISYDLKNDNFVSGGVGLAYDNECTSLSLVYSNSRDRYSGTETGRSLTFNIGLRTLGSYGYKYDIGLPEEVD